MIPRDKQHILDPDKWSNWPYLPMIHRPRLAAYKEPNTACIVGDPKDSKVYFVPGLNLWRLDEEKMKNDGTWREIDEILAEGWMVD